MSQIAWEVAYSVNNSVVDAQHKEWIAIYNKLDHILLNGSGRDVHVAAEEALQAMQDYANYHFRHEEQYMKEIGYPDLVAHKRLHTDFDDLVYTYGRKIRNGELVLNTELLAIIKKWLIHHILKEDQKYCVFMNKG